MSIDLPQTGNIFLPTVPRGVRDVSGELDTYLKQLNAVIEILARRSFNNDLNIANVISSGTSGTFNIASGGHIVITSGIVQSVSTT